MRPHDPSQRDDLVIEALHALTDEELNQQMLGSRSQFDNTTTRAQKLIAILRSDHDVHARPVDPPPSQSSGTTIFQTEVPSSQSAASILKTAPPSPQSASAVAVVRRPVPPGGLTLSILRTYTDEELDLYFIALGINREHIPNYLKNKMIVDEYNKQSRSQTQQARGSNSPSTEFLLRTIEIETVRELNAWLLVC